MAGLGIPCRRRQRNRRTGRERGLRGRRRHRYRHRWQGPSGRAWPGIAVRRPDRHHQRPRSDPLHRRRVRLAAAEHRLRDPRLPVRRQDRRHRARGLRSRARRAQDGHRRDRPREPQRLPDPDADRDDRDTRHRRPHPGARRRYDTNPRFQRDLDADECRRDTERRRAAGCGRDPQHQGCADGNDGGPARAGPAAVDRSSSRCSRNRRTWHYPPSPARTSSWAPQAPA